MPALNVDRNILVLLGSYLSNLTLQLQRTTPFLQRSGDLLQRESLITDAAQRQELQELARQVGSILEDISRATGSVAHFYKNLELGSAPGQGKTQPQVFDKTFESLIKECEVLKEVPR